MIHRHFHAWSPEIPWVRGYWGCWIGVASFYLRGSSWIHSHWWAGILIGLCNPPVEYLRICWSPWNPSSIERKASLNLLLELRICEEMSPICLHRCFLEPFGHRPPDECDALRALSASSIDSDFLLCWYLADFDLQKQSEASPWQTLTLDVVIFHLHVLLERVNSLQNHPTFSFDCAYFCQCLRPGCRDRQQVFILQLLHGRYHLSPSWLWHSDIVYRAQDLLCLALLPPRPSLSPS